MNRIVFATAQELATGIRQRRVSAAEVLEAHLAQIARHNPALNAIVTLDEERARKRAREADMALARGEFWGPLHGVPVTIKDAIETAGLRTTGGFPPLADYVPTTDAPVVARLKAAGVIIMGKTNLPVLSADYRADNPIFGRTNNPWNLERRIPRHHLINLSLSLPGVVAISSGKLAEWTLGQHTFPSGRICYVSSKWRLKTPH